MSSTVLAILLIAALAGGGFLWQRTQSHDGTGGSLNPSEAAGATEESSNTMSESSEAGTEPSPGRPQSTEAPDARPDIAYVRNGELWGLNDDGANRQQFFDQPLEVQHPDWTSDGRIAFSSSRDEGEFRDGDAEIWVVDANGQNPTQLTDNRVNDATPDWSPDGSRIAYSSSPDDRLRDIFVMDDDGSRQVNLTNTSEEDDDTPDWSPDGTQIVWEREVSGQHDIWRMDANGSNAKAVDRHT